MSGPIPPRRRLWLRLFLSFCIFCVVAFSLLGWYVTTDSFQRLVRRRVISSLEKVTGGRVELGQLHTIPFRLRIDARDLTVHGREAAGQAPYLHVDRLQAELKIISLLSTTIGLHSVALEHPVMHLVVHPDGSTNQPSPPRSQSSPKAPLEQLFSLSVSHAEIQHGELQWDEERIPVNFDGRDVALTLNYFFLRQQYQVRVSVGSVHTVYPPYPAFVWRADASLLLARDHAEISKFTLASGGSEVHFQGRIEDFKNPRINGDYHGVLNLGEWAAIVPEFEFRRGTGQFEGKGSWSLRDFSAQGTLQAKDVDWASRNVKMQNARLAAAFNITPQRFHLSALKASLLGGDLQGDVDITNWQNSLEPAPSGKRRRVVGRVPAESLQRGSVRLQLTGFPVAPALSLVSSKKLPLDRLNLSGAASGEINMLWVGSIRDAETQIKLTVAPPAQPAPGQLALRGQMEGVYRGSRDELEVSQLHLFTPASEITASGSLSGSSALKLVFQSHNVREWNPLLQAAYGSPDLPFAVHGWASFNGTVSGRLSAFLLDGNLEAYDFETTLPATAQIPERVVHWDALTTGLQYSNANFAARNGALVHGRTLAHFDFSTGLAAATFQENSPFTFHLDILNADVGEVAQLAGSSRPISGTGGLSATLTGTRADPRGEGHIEIRDAIVYGLPLPNVRGDLNLAHHELQFNNLAGTLYDAPLSGNAAINTTSSDFRLNLTGKNLDLARLPVLHTRIAVDGHADFDARVSGTPKQPFIEAHVQVHDLALDQERAGDLLLDAVTRGHQLDIQAHSKFEQGNVNVQGTVGLERDFPADLNLDFQHFDVDSLLNVYLQGKVTGHSFVAGTVHLRGPLRNVGDLKVSAQIQTLSAELEHVQLQNVEPVRFEIADQVVRLEAFHVTGSGTDFTAHGTAQLARARGLDFHLEGAVNMSLLHTINPKLSARGSVAVKLDANGTVSQPVLQGRLEVKDTFLSHDDFPSGLSDLKGVLLFDRNRIQIESLKGTTGGGSVTLTGSGSYQNGTFLMDLGATAHDVRLRYPPGVSSTANAELRLTGSATSALLSGDVVVTKLAVTPGFDFASYLEKSKQAAVVAQRDSIESRLKLDVHVTTMPELQMLTAMAKLSGAADLRVRGTADRPVILGRSISEGDVTFNGTKYHVDRADITFSNPARTEAIIDLQASTRVRDYDITVTLSGNLSKPNSLKPTWRSEPPLPEDDVIALLALGRTREESASAQSSGTFGFGGEASNLLINQALNTTVNSRLQRLFGASRIKIDPQGLASATNIVRGPQVTIEQQVASNVTVTYSTNVSVASQQIIQVEVNLSRNVSVVALRDQNGIVSFDLKIRRRKR